MVAGLSLLASQAKGQIAGTRVTFDVTGREDQLFGSHVLARIVNSDTARLNLSNEPKEIQIKSLVNFKAERRNLALMGKPTILRDSNNEQ